MTSLASSFEDMVDKYRTPFELGNGNQTTTYEDCIQFYGRLAADFPSVLQFKQLCVSDANIPCYTGVVMRDMIAIDDFLSDGERLRGLNRPILFNNNGHHPGEPEGIDVCMAFVRDLCIGSTTSGGDGHASVEAVLGDVIFVFNPIYNVDGCRYRNTTSRANQDGPESFGKRCNSLNLDQNRDMIKCDSTPSQYMNRLLAAIDPDVMVDMHCSNGADYQYTMTLIHTQTEKLGGSLGCFLKQTMLPALYAGMEAKGWPMCPYVNTIGDTPETGIEDFPDTPRFLSGYCALKHTIGFIPETHMLKPYNDRVISTRVLLDVLVSFVVREGSHIQQLRQQTRDALKNKVGTPPSLHRIQSSTSDADAVIPLTWEIDRSRFTNFSFRGYEAEYIPSLLGNYKRLRYDRSRPYTRDIAYYNTCIPARQLSGDSIPMAYIIPAAYGRTIVERLRWNRVEMHQLPVDIIAKEITCENSSAVFEYYSIDEVETRNTYEGHPFHSNVKVSRKKYVVTDSSSNSSSNADDKDNQITVARKSDWMVILQEQQDPRYIIETLEPEGSDSFFRWGFFNAILEKKEGYSDYAFEDDAMEMLKTEIGLKEKFEAWKAVHPELISSSSHVLNFLFENGQRYRELEYRRYPVVRVMDIDAARSIINQRMLSAAVTVTVAGSV